MAQLLLELSDPSIIFIFLLAIYVSMPSALAWLAPLHHSPSDPPKAGRAATESKPNMDNCRTRKQLLL